MPLLAWDTVLYGVGVRAVDDQHKRLVEMINQLHEAQLQGQSTGVTNQVLSDLVAYTDYHFATEEYLMRTHQCSDYMKHKTQHDELRQKALGLQTDVRNGKRAVSIDLLLFLRDWLSHHIQGTDKRLGMVLNQRGVF